MKFEDLTPYDLQLMKSMAVAEFTHGKKCASEALIEIVFETINAKGYSIVKDESKEETMRNPRSSWYTEPTPSVIVSVIEKDKK